MDKCKKIKFKRFNKRICWVQCHDYFTENLRAQDIVERKERAFKFDSHYGRGVFTGLMLKGFLKKSIFHVIELNYLIISKGRDFNEYFKKMNIIS